MKYFIDFEFIEGFTKPGLWPLVGKKRHFIDLISVGIYCEDGREYYAISKDFNPKDANDWVRENVLSKLPTQYPSQYDSPRLRSEAMLWKRNNLISFEILEFFKCEYDNGFWSSPEGIEVYGYYADYDWVLFCSLFGRMIDLPKGFPMYCKDLKHMLDDNANGIKQLDIKTLVYNSNFELLKRTPEHTIKDISEWTFDQKLTMLKAHANYPKQSNEHNALSDAKWNYELYKFIQTI